MIDYHSLRVSIEYSSVTIIYKIILGKLRNLKKNRNHKRNITEIYNQQLHHIFFLQFLTFKLKI